ncbi:MAG: hypothetical protein J6U48_03345 [Alistipes sp.]|nr:hypothetical protein [Alistipes sp.]
MRRITKLMASVAMLLVLSLATSCETLVNYLDTPQTPEPPTEEEYVTVSLGFDFVDLEVGYEPLSRAKENNDVYGIQVYSTPAPATECPEWKPFAYGAFYSTDNLSINLLKGYEYKFVATMVKDGKEKLYYEERWDNGVYLGEEYYSPISSVVSDNFKYGLDDHWELGCGFSWLNLVINGYIQTPNRPNLERYYGELEGYTPGDKGGKAKIQLKRTSFGAKFIAKGKNAGSGTLEILMDGAMQVNLNLAESNQVSDIYTFDNVYEAWFDNNYSETFPVVLRLVREDGTTVPLGTHNLTFKRNATTVVNVSMDDTSEASGVGVEFLESGEMPEGDEVTIEDGEIVDTEVDTNK